MRTESEAEYEKGHRERTVSKMKVFCKQVPSCQSRRGLDYSTPQYHIPYPAKAPQPITRPFLFPYSLSVFPSINTCFPQGCLQFSQCDKKTETYKGVFSSTTCRIHLGQGSQVACQIADRLPDHQGVVYSILGIP